MSGADGAQGPPVGQPLSQGTQEPAPHPPLRLPVTSDRVAPPVPSGPITSTRTAPLAQCGALVCAFSSCAAQPWQYSGEWGQSVSSPGPPRCRSAVGRAFSPAEAWRVGAGQGWPWHEPHHAVGPWTLRPGLAPSIWWTAGSGFTQAAPIHSWGLGAGPPSRAWV